MTMDEMTRPLDIIVSPFRAKVKFSNLILTLKLSRNCRSFRSSLRFLLGKGFSHSLSCH